MPHILGVQSVLVHKKTKPLCMARKVIGDVLSKEEHSIKG